MCDVSPKLPVNVYCESVISIKHYTDRLFRFCITRPKSFRFRSGEFVMLGLMVNGRRISRAYSMASPCWDDKLEFFSIKVEQGPLTTHLQNIQPGDTILLHKKSTGTLVLDALIPGNRLYLFSTGTGIAPFVSVIRDPGTYEKFDEVIVTQTCRQVVELQYGIDVMHEISQDEILKDLIGQKLKFYRTVTQEDYLYKGRITNHILSGEFYRNMDLSPLNPDTDRIMICGSPTMIVDMKDLLIAKKFREGSNSRPGTFVVERAFSL
ncbi:ferredoxin--NADP reductase [Candidatus Liberibacter asiaticus]|uniref:ferredoxin--NADP(+) reductase n=6 Tax=Liberibacter asiaticus TaxID=34021 RepID=C6XHU3_LIBAP|nr:ferredoxin--NADP reductase [Candidatus Liberibacter asiaticus]ACT56836.1 ferredoxin-NADP+ reductase protein [Candidatus Liberibacter asiaticus str. psy62]ALK06991.1 ferredoxin--NADP reductase [Candidatus Liberibacter asiaticus]ASK52462.1 ferredoxin--NADP(+) reductase [Candidatus Liberibacter asiaticus]AWL13787.1 ferredoxin--NADP reductase [Candidatus Liberibacter asiaticus]KAE9520040.1 Ferredoxin--NADP reductase [Candidatus Liberibacter asiaticus]